MSAIVLAVMLVLGSAASDPVLVSMIDALDHMKARLAATHIPVVGLAFAVDFSQ